MCPPIVIYRLGNLLYRNGFSALAKLVTWINRLIFSAFVPSTANIGSGVVLGKWGLGVVIHDDAIIGDHCLIRHNVTIGKKEGDTRVPKLGKRVIVGAGAVIIGEIEIGDDCVIGANAVVTKSFPNGSTIVGIPGVKVGNDRKA